MANGDFAKGVVLGVAAAALAPLVLRALGVRGEALGAAASRAGLMLGQKAREIVTEIGEIAEDAMAEMQAHPSEDVDNGMAGDSPAEDLRTTRSA